MVIGERIPRGVEPPNDPQHADYLSTSCYHAAVTVDPAAVQLFHERCRRTCDWCRALCICECHKGEANALAE